MSSPSGCVLVASSRGLVVWQRVASTMPRKATRGTRATCPKCGQEKESQRAECRVCADDAALNLDGSSAQTEDQLLGMGFSRRSVKEARRAVGSSFERAISWLLDGTGQAPDSSQQAPTRSRGLPEAEGEDAPVPKRQARGVSPTSRATPVARTTSNSSFRATPPSSPAGASARPFSPSHDAQ